ncbi:MAG: hypothetical protein IT222_11250 [Crocinitomix sp.]|nr:hypothetical protein [Crocinitomix sp.]
MKNYPQLKLNGERQEPLTPLSVIVRGSKSVNQEILTVGGQKSITIYTAKYLCYVLVRINHLLVT